MKQFAIIFLALFLVCTTFAQQPPKREVRAVWLTTAWRLDWPAVTVPAPIFAGDGVTITNEAARANARNIQQRQMLDILDNLQATNYNTIYFQVRPMHDAFYRSNLPGEAWSQYLSSERGADPGWSPLGFLIEHAHARGMEVHAWLNPYRYSTVRTGVGANHGTLPTDIATTHPHWLILYPASGITILNPGIPEVRQYIADVVEDIIRNYNVDGIVFDDYFYRANTINAMDDAQFATYPNGFTNVQRADWRRNNINMMIRDVQARINSISPWIQFGVSPAGVAIGDNPTVANIYNVRPLPGTNDWQRNEIFASPIAWLRDGTIDYISPQIYWDTFDGGAANPSFGNIANWWGEVSNQFGRHFFSSNTSHRGGSPNDPSRPPYPVYNRFSDTEVLNQIQILRNADRNGTAGQVHFRYGTYLINLDREPGEDRMRLYNAMRNDLYRYHALTAMFGWKSAPMQDLVTNLSVSEQNLTWDYAPNVDGITWNYTPNVDFSFVRYAIYAIPIANRNDADAFTSPRFLQGISYTTNFTLPAGIYTSTHSIAVAVFDRFGNLFPPRVLDEAETTIEPAQLTFPANEQMNVPVTATFTWQAVTDADYYVWQLARDAAFTQLLASRETTEPSAGLNFIDAQRAANGHCFVKPNTRYFWRVKSIRANAPVSVSDIWVFNGVHHPPTYTVTFSASGNGTLTATVDGTEINSGTEVEEGKNVIFTAKPNENYKIKSWTVNGTEIDGTPTTYTLSNLTAKAEVTVVFESETGAGLGNLSHSIQVFPNPFSDKIHIVNAELGSTLLVLNVSGIVVYTQEITSSYETIQLEQLPKGIYILQIGERSVRIVKN